MGYHSYQPGVLGAFVVFDLVVQILSILGNSLVLCAVVKVKIGLAGYRRFLVSLLANNIFLSVAQVFIAIYLESDSTLDRKHSCVGTFLDSLKLFAVFAALFNLCGMSADHLMGIIHPLKYDYLMNTRWAKAAPIFMWIFAFVFGFADIPIAAVVYYLYSYRPVKSGASYLALFEALMNSSSTSVENSQRQQPIFEVQTIFPPTTIVPLLQPDALSNHQDLGYDDQITFASSSSSSYYYHQTSQGPEMLSNYGGGGSSFYDPLAELKSLRDIDVDLLKEETDWCLISYSYKLYWVQYFRLICTIVVFVILVLCYGRIFGEIRRNHKYLSGSSSSSSASPSPSPFHSNGDRKNHISKQNSFSAETPNKVSLTRRHSTSIQRRSSRKFIMTTLLLLSAFAICWLPFIILEISVNPELANSPGDGDSAESWGLTKVHMLQHLFNSLFLSYPLLDAIICVSRVCSVRRYIHLLVLVPLKCYSGFQNSGGRDSNAYAMTPVSCVGINGAGGGTNSTFATTSGNTNRPSSASSPPATINTSASLTITLVNEGYQLRSTSSVIDETGGGDVDAFIAGEPAEAHQVVVLSSNSPSPSRVEDLLE